MEAGVAEGEHAAVAGREPVAGPGRGGGHGHDRPVELDRAGGAEEAGVAEAEHPSVGGREPVAGARRRGGDGHDRLVEAHPARRTEEPGAAEAEHAAVGSHQPGARGGREAGAVGGRARLLSAPGGPGVSPTSQLRSRLTSRERWPAPPWRPQDRPGDSETPSAAGATDGAHLPSQFTAATCGSCRFGGDGPGSSETRRIADRNVGIFGLEGLAAGYTGVSQFVLLAPGTPAPPLTHHPLWATPV